MVAALGGDDVVVPVVVDLVVEDGYVVAVVVGIEAVAYVVVHLVVPPVSLLVAVRVDSEIEVVDVGVVDVAEHINFIEQIWIALIIPVSSYLVGRRCRRFRGFQLTFCSPREVGDRRDGGLPNSNIARGNAVCLCGQAHNAIGRQIHTLVSLAATVTIERTPGSTHDHRWPLFVRPL